MTSVQEKFYEFMTYFKAGIVVILALLGLFTIIYVCVILVKTRKNIENVIGSKVLIGVFCILIVICSAWNIYNSYRIIHPLARDVILDSYSLNIINNQRYYEHIMRIVGITHIAMIVCVFNRLNIIKNRGKITPKIENK